MRFVENWRLLVRRAWSIRLMLLAGLLSAAEVILVFARDYFPMQAGIFALLAAVATGAALVARLIAQRSIHGGNDG